MSNVEKALAEIALAVNTGPCEVHVSGSGDKTYLMEEMRTYTQNAPAGVGRGMHMLLSLTLELWRRNEYIFEALQKNLDTTAFLQADAAYAARVDLHNRSLHAFEDPAPGATVWEDRAAVANDIVHRMLDITEHAHRADMAMVIAKLSDGQVGDVDTVERKKVTALARVPATPLHADVGNGHAGHGAQPPAALTP